MSAANESVAVKSAESTEPEKPFPITTLFLDINSGLVLNEEELC
jgi:hypothetical protein